MKCDNCGYIFNGDFDKCPYCGAVQSTEDKNILHNSVPLGRHNSIRVRTIYNIIFVNLFLTSFFVDWLIFNFEYRISLFSFILCFGAILMLSLFYNSVSPISSFERVNLYIIFSLLIGCGTALFGNVDLRPIFGFLVIPAYLLAASIVFTVMLLIGRGKKFRPLVAEVIMIFHLLLSTAVLVLFLVGIFSNKYCGWAVIPNLLIIQKIAIYGSFGLSVLLFLNFNLVLFLSIYNKVKYIYGK